MTPDEAATLASHLLATIQQESRITRDVIGALPDDKCAYRIHAKARTALELAWHIVLIEMWYLDSIFQGQFYTGPAMDLPGEIKTAADVISWYDTQLPGNLAKAGKLSGEYLARPINFMKRADYPGVIYLQILLSHTIHHRGQFSAYLRAMGARVPRIYYASLDEPADSSAKA
ncbi:MAG TPA: DinB family protein [Candidatus Acidoferrales bacterium]|nr:DinB family protein [Candidatus Acidoferrales bacterium]